MLMLDNFEALDTSDSITAARASLLAAVDMEALWQACVTLVTKSLPCHSCSLMFGIDDLQPRQGHHHLTERQKGDTPPVTSLDVAAPYLIANPKVRWYTFSQIASRDTLAQARLRNQNPKPGWREFIHLAFWNKTRLEAVLSIRLRADRNDLDNEELIFLTDLYPLLDAGLRRVRKLESERVLHRAFGVLLRKIPVAAAIVDHRLTPLYISPHAARLCRAWGKMAGTRLPGAIERQLRPRLGGQVEPIGDSMATSGGTVTIRHDSRPGLAMRIEISAALELAIGQRHHLLTMVPEDQHDVADGPFSTEALPLLQRLSPSERSVAALLAKGLRNEAIARRRRRSRKTVESQITSIYRKLEVENRSQLIRLLS